MSDSGPDRDQGSDPSAPHPRNQLNDLTAKEWIPETVSVWTQRGLGAKHPDTVIERAHPAPFSFTDVGRLIRFFTKQGNLVLDPFVGIGSTLKACAVDQRRGIGVELNPTFATLARRRLETEVQDLLTPTDDQQVLEGDARDVLPTIPTDSVDFIVTSPPYWNILNKQDHKVRQERVVNGLATNYGSDPRDLGNLKSYTDFLQQLTAVFKECHRTLRAGRYAAIVVSDFRHKSRYVMFHADLTYALEPIGLSIRGITVLYQRHKKIYPYGYPYSYVPNIHNQYILIFQKV